MEFYNRKLLIIDDDITVETVPLRPRPPPPPPLQHSNASSPQPHAPLRPGTTPFDSSMALTVLVLLAALFFMGFFSVYIRRFADRSPVDLSRRRRRRRISTHPSRAAKGSGPDAASAVRSLPILRYCRAAEEEPIECAVCLGEFDEGDTIKVIPSCRHLFHPSCIDTWLSLHLSCPLCRTTRLFPVKSGVCSDGVGSGVAQGDVRLDESEIREESTAEIEGERSTGAEQVGPDGVRRTSSCSSIGEPAAQLRRTASF